MRRTKIETFNWQHNYSPTEDNTWFLGPLPEKKRCQSTMECNVLLKWSVVTTMWIKTIKSVLQKTNALLHTPAFYEVCLVVLHHISPHYFITHFFHLLLTLSECVLQCRVYLLQHFFSVWISDAKYERWVTDYFRNWFIKLVFMIA